MTLRAEYYQAIRDILMRAKAVVYREVVVRLEEFLHESALERGEPVRRDAGGKKVNDLIDRISKQFFEDLKPTELEALARKYAQRASDLQKIALQRQIKAAVGVDVFAAEPNLAPYIADFVAENVALIKSVPNKYLDEVEGVVTRGVRAGARAGEIAAELQDRFAVSESRAALIARDQIGKFYGELNEVRQQALGVERYIWRTVRDNRVREEHAERDGQVFSWDDPPEDGHPGEPINCRCYAEPDLSSILEAVS